MLFRVDHRYGFSQDKPVLFQIRALPDTKNHLFEVNTVSGDSFLCQKDDRFGDVLVCTFPKREEALAKNGPPET